MVENYSALRRALDMIESDVKQHEKILHEFSMKLDAIYIWQRQKDIRDGRQEEREKVVIEKLDNIHKMTKAVVGVLFGGIGAAIVAFIINGGLVR